MYSQYLLNSNCRKLCKNKLSRVVPNATNTGLTQIRNAYMYAARHGRGGEERLIASTYSKQGQKVHPNRQHIYGNQRRKLSPKKADWKQKSKQIKCMIKYYEATPRASSKTQT